MEYLSFSTVLFFGGVLLVWYVLQKKHKGSQTMTHSGNLDLFTTDVTAKAARGEIEPFSEREAEIERTVHILLRRSKNNPILIGEPGVGKTAIAEGLALAIVQKKVPTALQQKRMLSLDLNNLMSETHFRGSLEARLRDLISGVQAKNADIILFIDEIHLLEQAGKSEGALSISDVLKPALSRGEIQVVGATTWKEYNKYIRENEALDRRFQPVLVDEPNREQALAMLRHLRHVYEDHHGVTITDAALEAAVRLSDESIKSRYLPDKAIDLIDEAAAKVSIEAEQGHKIPLGLLDQASRGRNKDDIVDVEDIQSVVDQWIIHSKEEKKRDARNNS